MSGLVLDTGALIALERRHRQSALDLQVAAAEGVDITIPAGCLAQAWRDGGRQNELVHLLAGSETTVEDLDGRTARRIGELLARTGASDVVDGHVALVALRDGRTIVTSDPGDLRRLAPNAVIAPV